MKVPTPRFLALAVATSLLAASTAPAADTPPKKLEGLSKDQIRALPDSQPA